MKPKTFKECCGDVAVKYGLGKTLVTGHKASYWTEAAENYADQFKHPDGSKEKILCAANWYKELSLAINDIPNDLLRPKNCNMGIVFCGHRHPHCLYQMVAITGKAQHEVGEEVQGFLTNNNRFVDRYEAATIFINGGGTLKYHSNQLFSEDLY